jgi:uncharacterized protein (TIGR03067 family)
MKAALWGFGFVLAAGVAMGGEAKDKLQGSWTAEKEGKKIVLRFSKDSFTLTFDGKASFKGTYKFDGSKKPKELDMTITEGEKFQGKTSKAIFEVDGDTLKWCANEPGKDNRPKDFTDKGDDGGHLNIVYKRTK